MVGRSSYCIALVRCVHWSVAVTVSSLLDDNH